MMENLEGQRYGRLVVIEDLGLVDGYHRVRCLCDCGNETVLRAASLRKSYKPTQSCGCLQREAGRQSGLRTVADNSYEQVQRNIRLHTNTQVIKTKTPPRNNTSGHKGVSFNSTRGKYEAYLKCHGILHHLGKYSRYEDAVRAREEAEAKYFDPILEAEGLKNYCKE